MKLFFFCLLGFLFLTLFTFFLANSAYAYGDTFEWCDKNSRQIVKVSYDDRVSQNTTIEVRVQFDPAQINYNWNYYVVVSDQGPAFAVSRESGKVRGADIKNNPTITFYLNGIDNLDSYAVELRHSEGPGSSLVCQNQSNRIHINDPDIAKISECSLTMPKNIGDGSNWSIDSTIKSVDNSQPQGVEYRIIVTPKSNIKRLPKDVFKGGWGEVLNVVTGKNTEHYEKIPFGANTISVTNKFEKGEYITLLGVLSTKRSALGGGQTNYICVTTDFTISNDPTSTTPETSTKTQTPYTIDPPGKPAPGSPGCIKGGDKTDTRTCTTSGGLSCNPKNKGLPGPGGVSTAIGCVPTDPKELIPQILRFAFGIAGGIAFLLMVLGVFHMITSAGNPDGVKKGWEQLGSAIQGLLVILFAVLLLQIIGFDILGLPGFDR